MSSDVVSPLLQWLNTNPELAGLATFIISAAESVAIIGTIVPGSITMTAIGTLAGAGIIPLWGTIIWAILGAIVGDGISFWMGRYFGTRLHNIWPFKNNPNVLNQGEMFVRKYGVMSVFLGRFVGPVRALVPLVAGMFGMKPLQFYVANVISAIGWAPAYMLPGIMLGAASLELPPDIALHVFLVLFIIGLFSILCLWIGLKLLQLIHLQTSQFQAGIWRRLEKSKYSSMVTIVLKHHDAKRTSGQLTLATYFIIIAGLFCALALYIHFNNPVNLMINNAMYHLFRGIRTSDADSIMIYFTLLGQKQVMLPVLAITAAWLALRKNTWAAIHVIELGLFAVGSVYVFKHFVQSPRPWGILVTPTGFSMPSGHTTIAATVFLGLAYIMTRGVRPAARWFIYFVALLIAATVSTSRLYLGAHWFTDVFGAWLLSFAILIFVAISYQRRVSKPVNPYSMALVFVLALSVSLYTYQYRAFDTLKTDYSQVSWPSLHISMKEWWQKNNLIPAYRTSLFGFPSQRINIEWTGSIDEIRETLLAEGWSKPPTRDWISTMHRISGISSTQYLPLISPQYLDKKPELTLTRQANGSKNLYLIRLWDANRIMLNTNNMHLWVGFVSKIPKSYNWLFHREATEVTIEPTMIFYKKALDKRWESKMLTIKAPNYKMKITEQKVILIKPTHIKSHQE
jgi:membrane protein DedA with SNARE-associated domain/membrane-associated phospholipid phosphatase